MSPIELYTVARQVGFPPDTAEKMVAIAMKESGGNPRAFNGVPPDKSYGLYQINMLGALGPDRIRLFGLSREEDLFDPVVNTRAAYKIWAGSDANLGRHWYIDRGVNQERFLRYLPEGKAARAAVEGDTGTADTGADPVFSVTGYGVADPWAPSPEFVLPGGILDRIHAVTGSETRTLLLGVGLILLLGIAASRRD
jgi:hypothetical protein